MIALSGALLAAMLTAGAAFLHWSRPEVVATRPPAAQVAPAAPAGADTDGDAPTPAATSR